ncbi:hypothetical protein M431DRAFT_10504 [Trichoderma harzianum CBS 226.95]|uniref:Uncharacterized protein n=1 Tax=Trichoderma harzianum CBS 226.95 TaxID=983964 RepID=A0A2T3ZVH6_TRIHA|nr:hypothetical protein M431DRAFT_10504 [Trichoderma harzianum CBS 226.95]PTB48812.1 hypothetical protein M431DRAFT_10504 [Trichoderma harzianum CBS 226.95]
MGEGARSDVLVTPNLNEGDIEDTASAITVAPDTFWMALIEKEASALLNLIRKTVDPGKILLVGYGFGGIVIKKAMFLAKTNSKFKDIVFQVDRVQTPRDPLLALPLINPDFHDLALLYTIANFIEKSDESAAKPITAEGELANGMDDVELGPEKEPQNFTLHEIATLDHLETLRTLVGLKQACSNGLSSCPVPFAEVAIFSRFWRFVTQIVLTYLDVGLTSSQHDYGAICDYKYLLHRAALDDKLEAFKALLRLSENDSEANDEEMTPLHMAAAGGSMDVISHLLGKCTIEHEPTNVGVLNLLDKQDNKGRTPLIMAASMGHEEATKLLLQSGANISMQDDTKKTALHYGALKSLVAVEDFISSDLLSVHDKDGRTALHIAASSRNSGMTSKIVDVLKKEFRFEEAINCRDRTKKTPLQYAAEQGHTAIVKEFLSHQDCVDTKNYNSAAELAAAGGHLSTVRLFMSKSKGKISSQLLVVASEVGNLEIVLYLLTEMHVDPSIQWEGRLPICQAAVGGHLGVVYAFLLREKGFVEQKYAIRQKYGIGQEDGIWQKDGKEKTALHYACDGGVHEMVKILLLYHAVIDARDCNGETPLHIAARKGRINVINLLLEFKANIHLRSKKEETPPHIAVHTPKPSKPFSKPVQIPTLSTRKHKLHYIVLFYRNAGNRLHAFIKMRRTLIN